MDQKRVLDRSCVIFTAVVFLLSLILFTTDTNEFWGSLVAAFLSAGLAFMTYIILKWFWLAIRS